MQSLVILASVFLASTVSAVVVPRAPVAASIAWDSNYGNGDLSTLSVACSNGLNGLYSKGYKTLGALPSFPNVAAIQTVTGWNDADCGKCYKATFRTKSVYITAVDVAGGGIVTSKATLNTLTGGLAEELGRVDGTFEEVAASNCGL